MKNQEVEPETTMNDEIENIPLITSKIKKNRVKERVNIEMKGKTIDDSHQDDESSSDIIVLQNMTIKEVHSTLLTESTMNNGHISYKLIPLHSKWHCF